MKFPWTADFVRQFVAILSDANTESRSPFRQFSLQSLLAATVFIALGLWAWRASGFLGVACLVAFVGIVVGNLGIALYGAKFRYGILAGTLGGAILWSVVGLSQGMLDAGVFRFGVSLYFAFIGVLAGLVCGGYARLKCRQVDTDRRKGRIYCVVLFVVFCTVFGGGRILAFRKLLQPDFNSIISWSPDSDGTYVVEFWGNGIGDLRLSSHLAEIPRNRKLAVYFRHTRVTDEGIRNLGNFPNLVSVDMSGTSVSEDGENWLRGRLPDCAIRR